MSNVKKSVLTAVCIALCLVLPMAFHAIPNAGAVALPMHIPVLLCGLFCGASYGLVCGAAGPLLSHLLTGMPLAGVLPFMMVECAVYGLVTGLMMKVKTKRVYADLYLSLVVAMVAGRVAWGVTMVFFALISDVTFSVEIYKTSVINTWPGIMLQLMSLPPLIVFLQTAYYPDDIQAL